MPLQQTTILEPGDAGEQVFQGILTAHNHALLVVAGDTQEVINFIENADNAAQDTDPNCLVIWSQDPGCVSNINTADGFSVATDGTVCDTFSAAEFSYGRAVAALVLAVGH